MQAHVRDGAGKVVFDANVGGIVTDLESVPGPDGNLLVVACDGLAGNLSCFAGDGRVCWRLSLPGIPRRLTVCGGVIGAACDDGILRLVNCEGRTVGAVPFPKPAEAVCSGITAGGEPVVICAAANLLTAIPIHAPER